MSETITRTELFDSTTATVTFANGHVMTFESGWESAQNNGNTYSGADWTTFGQFSKKVEKSVREAQELWGLPDAEIRYDHTRRAKQIVERRIDRREFVCTRTLALTTKEN